MEQDIVWSFLAIFADMVALEFRATTRDSSSLEYIQKGVDTYNNSGNDKSVPSLKLCDLKNNLSGGSSLSESQQSALGERTRKLRWLSPFEKHAIVLVVNNDTDEALVFDARPADAG